MTLRIPAARLAKATGANKTVDSVAVYVIMCWQARSR